MWSTAAKLGYGDVFVNQKNEIDDDHDAFLKRGVSAVDIIDLAGPQRAGYWHTLEDTLDKVSPSNLAIVGHVLMETLPQLEQKFGAH